MRESARDTADEAAEAGNRVRVVRATVPGRARLAVPGLARNRALKTRLEAELFERPGIVRAEANQGTGNLLVLYDPSRSLDYVVATVEGLLNGGAANADSGTVVPLRPGPADGGGTIDAESAPAPPPWHSIGVQDVAAEFGTDLTDGLTAEQAATLLREYGPNELRKIPPRSDLDILLGQFGTLPVGLLLGSALLSAGTGGLLDAAAILSVLAANAGIGFATESQAERTIDALSALVEPDAHVRRAGRPVRIPARAVVPGDVIELSPGTMVAADGRVFRARELTVDESALTGESLPSGKRAETLPMADTPLAERHNMVYRATAVTGGSGRAVVVGTGADSEVGRIQNMVAAAAQRETPMQRQLETIGRQLSWATLGAAGLALAAGLLRGRPPLEMVKTAVSLGVAALPEGLPTVATVTLALGIRTMRRRKVLVRRLDAVEALGSVGVMCFDKTGTLTENRIEAVAVLTPDGEVDIPEGVRAGAAHVEDLLRVAVLCNETEIEETEDGEWRLKGSGTEASLIELARRAGLDVRATRREAPRESVDYRTLERRYMVSRHTLDGRILIAVKGNPAEVLALCGTTRTGGERKPLSRARRQKILSQNEDLASRGLRVLGFASATVADGGEEDKLIWHGLVGLADPTRAGMKELIETFHRAGIRTVMITGDQSSTAYAVARELDLAEGDTVEVLEGTQLDEMDPSMLSALARQTDVFARVTPANKLQIVRAFQDAGYVVAMTGDGINDSPALRAADIGVAMGTGSDAAHQVAEVILEDDRIETMPVAVELGRRTFANIRKALRFLLSTNLSEILVTTAATAATRSPPMSPLQLLWINLVTDVAPALALALEPAEPGVMEEPPRAAKETVLRPQDFRAIGVQGAMFSGAALLSQALGTLRYGPGEQATGMAFTTLTASQLLHALSSRSDRVSLFGAERLQPNRYLTRAMGGLAAMQAGVSLFPPARRLLGLSRLGVSDLALAGGLALLPYLAVEAMKLHREAGLPETQGDA